MLVTLTLILVEILCSAALTMFARPQRCLLGTDLLAHRMIPSIALSTPESLTAILLLSVAICV